MNHGTASTYTNHGCRCDLCRSAYSLYQADYKARRRVNGGKRLTQPITAEERHKRESARVVAWQKANPEKYKAKQARHRDKHREQRRAESLARYYKQMEENPEKVRANRRRFQTSEKGRAYQRVANYRRRSLPMSQEVRDWWLAQRNAVCGYCWVALATEIDHITPVSRGGTNDLDNLVPVCRSCNASKNDKTLAEWIGA